MSIGKTWAYLFLTRGARAKGLQDWISLLLISKNPSP